MNVMRTVFLFGLLATVGLLAFQPAAIADPGFADDDEPIEVGKAGVAADDGPLNPKVIKASSGVGAAVGDVSMELKNTSGKSVTDVHVKITEPTGAKIKQISTVGVGGNSPFTVNDPDGSGGVGGAKQTASAGSPAQGSSLADGSKIIVDVSVIDANGNDLDDAAVKFEVWWTRGPDRDIVVSATSSKEIGDGAPRTSLASMNTTYSWGFDFSVSEVSAESTVDLNDLPIAECDGFRFQEGSLVLRPSNSTRFSDDFESFSISARSGDNDNVLGTGRFSAGEPRIDSRGNFVIDITRNQDDTEHIVIILSGLKISNLENHEAGQKVYADVSGAAVAGYCMHGYFHLLTVVE